MGELGPECGRSLRILFTNNTLALRAGSELFVFDLAVALRRRGHQPIVFSAVLGEVAEQLRSAAVPVIDDLGLLTVTPDVIHGQHHLELATALLHFPNVPAIHVCHGWLPWEETPLRFPTIRKYVAVSDLTRERLFTSGIPAQSIETAYNFVDTERFKLRDWRPGSSKTAAVFSNYLSSEHPHYLNILAACQQLQFEKVDLFGGTAGSPIPNPEEVLPNYGVVFAAGRCALEALACGCAVIIADHHGLGAWVTTDNLERFRRGNFGIAVTYGNELTPERVVAELLRIAPGEVEAVTSRIRATASLASYVEIWERIYIDAVAASSASISPDALTLAASHYLRTLNPVIKARHSEWNSLLSKTERDEVRLAALERDAAALTATLNERAAQLTQAQGRIAVLEASAKEVERRAVELGATVNQSTAELAGARDRGAALWRSLAGRDRVLALLALFREMYRPIRRLRASRFGVNLRAAWRHPRDSRKRKLYRVNHTPRRPPAPPCARPTKFTAKLRALTRYPFSPKRRRAYREQLRSIPS